MNKINFCKTVKHPSPNFILIWSNICIKIKIYRKEVGFKKYTQCYHDWVWKPIALNSVAWTAWVLEEIQGGRNRRAMVIGKEWTKKKKPILSTYESRSISQPQCVNPIWKLAPRNYYKCVYKRRADHHLNNYLFLGLSKVSWIFFKTAYALHFKNTSKYVYIKW